MVPGKYTDLDGYPLGQWIIKTRQQKLNGRLKEERIAQLDEIGMVWNIFDAKWEKAYVLAAAYYDEIGMRWETRNPKSQKSCLKLKEKVEPAKAG